MAIHLERHDSLDVFPMMQATLRPDNLLVSTSDKDSNRQIKFLVKKPPKMGRLLLRMPTSNKVSEIRFFEMVENKENWVLGMLIKNIFKYAISLKKTPL